jgi:threonyl-tRNA synthetase
MFKLEQEYWKRGFQEVISPNMYNAKLWKTSGHWDHYAENMFRSVDYMNDFTTAFNIVKESLSYKDRKI